MEWTNSSRRGRFHTNDHSMIENTYWKHIPSDMTDTGKYNWIAYIQKRLQVVFKTIRFNYICITHLWYELAPSNERKYRKGDWCCPNKQQYHPWLWIYYIYIWVLYIHYFRYITILEVYEKRLCTWVFVILFWVSRG